MKTLQKIHLGFWFILALLFVAAYWASAQGSFDDPYERIPKPRPENNDFQFYKSPPLAMPVKTATSEILPTETPTPVAIFYDIDPDFYIHPATEPLKIWGDGDIYTIVYPEEIYKWKLIKEPNVVIAPADYEQIKKENEYLKRENCLLRELVDVYHKFVQLLEGKS